MPLRIVLAGGGLCNIQVVKLLHDFFTRFCPEEVTVTLISSFEFTYYSAMYPGLLAHQYDESEIRVELKPLCLACNTHLIISEIVQINHTGKLIMLRNGTEVPYDVLSINIGSRTKGTDLVNGLAEYAIMTRPLDTFLRKLEDRELKLIEANEEPRVVVVGAGASGIELALVLRSRFATKFTSATITILDCHAKVFPSSTSFYREVITKNLQQAGVKLFTNSKVKEIREHELELVDGRIMQTNLVVWATGPVPHDIVHDLATCRKGFILVNQCMQSIKAVEVFAGGDCVTIQGFPSGFPPKTGAHALREGPILAFNIISLGKHLLYRFPPSFMLYQPQIDLMLLINLGDGRGVVTKYGMTFSGKWVFQLKNHINKKLIKKYSPQRLLGEKAYVLYRELGPETEAVRLIYAAREILHEDYSTINWYDYSRRGKDVEDEVYRLDSGLALDLLLESSDTIKTESCSDFEFQFRVFKRTDRDTEFRTNLMARYAEAMQHFANLRVGRC